jgi:hypothetical protein
VTVNDQTAPADAALLALVAEHGLGEKTLTRARARLKADPGSYIAANIVGRSLCSLDETEQALEHWRTIVVEQPHNEIAKSQLKTLEGHLRYGKPKPAADKVK